MADIVKEIFSLDFGGDSQGVHALADAVERLQQEQEAAKKSGKGLEEVTTKLAAAQKKFVEATLGAGKANKDNKKATEDDTTAKKKNTDETLKGADAFKVLRQQIKAYKAEALAAGENTPVGQEFIRLAGEATDRLGDLNQSVLNLSKDTKTLNSVAEGARTFTAALQVGQGVAAQFVGDNEDLTKALVKLQGATAILSGLTEIQNALQEQSNLVIGLRKVQTLLLAGATAGMSVAELAAVVTTNLLTIATRALLGPLGLIIALAGAVIQVYSQLTGKSEEHKKALEKEKEELALLGALYKVYDEVIQRNVEQRKKQGDFEKGVAELKKDNEKEVLAIEQRSTDAQIKLLQKSLAKRFETLQAERGFTLARLKIDEQYIKVKTQIDDLLNAQILANLEFEKKAEEKRKKLKEDRIKLEEDFAKVLDKVRRDIADSNISQIKENSSREIAALQNEFGNKVKDLDLQVAEEAKILKKAVEDKVITQSKANEKLATLQSETARLKVSLEEATNEKIRQIQVKDQLDDINRELSHQQILGSLSGLSLQQQVNNLEKQHSLELDANKLSDKTEREKADNIIKINEDYRKKLEALETGDLQTKLSTVQTLQNLDATPFFAKFDLLKQERDLEKEIAGKTISDKALLAATLIKIDEDYASKRLALIDKLKNAAAELGQQTLDLANQTLEANIAETDGEIERQRTRVEEVNKIASQGNAEQLQLEQQRLDELNKKKEKYVRQQQALAVVELIANSAVAVSKAATEPFPFNLIAIGATLVALAAGISKAKATAAKAAFKDGVIDLQGPGTETSDSINARLSRRESVMTAKETKLYKPTLLAIRKGQVMPDALNKFATGQLVDKMLSVPMSTREAAAIDNSNLEARLMEVHAVLKEMPEQMGKYIQSSTLNITREGLYTTVKDYAKYKDEVSKRAS